MTIKVEGTFPKNSVPVTIRVEPEKGTFVLVDKDGAPLGYGQISCDF